MRRGTDRLVRSSLRIAGWSALLCALWTLLLGSLAPAGAQREPAPTEGNPDKPAASTVRQPILPYELGLQATLIDQQLFRFHSPYEGTNSFRSRDENEKSDTYTLYMGVRLTKTLEAFLNPEMARGNGISEALGVAGYTNGDVIRNPTLGQQPYLARYFLRQTFATGHGEEDIAPGENQIVGKRPIHRLVLTLGKLGTNDIFDTNRYANSTRTQFMNWALLNNAAYDYAADTRGYSQGIAAEWIQPAWAFRIGTFQMPTVANGPELAGDLIHNRGDQIELELHPRLLRKHDPLVLRLLGYRNFARMGTYSQSLALAKQTGITPDITATRRLGAVKYGWGLNFEQPLGDGGDTGVFGRYGWDDGRTESFAYTEVDRTFCLGAQLSGRNWHRGNDHLAVAFVQNDLTADHKAYLEAGGLGFLLGDGKLNYGSEQIVESYYSFQIAPPLALSLDYQFINNPGYNRDRGPASILSARLHLEF